jgi:hypothetical protein
MAARNVGLILPILTAVLAPGSEWPQFRGPNASGVSDESKLPVEFGPDRNVVWKTAVPPSQWPVSATPASDDLGPFNNLRPRRFSDPGWRYAHDRGRKALRAHGALYCFAKKD